MFSNANGTFDSLALVSISKPNAMQRENQLELERFEISQLYDGSDIVLMLRNLKPLQGVSSVRPLKANLDKDVDRVLKLQTSLF